MLPSSPSPFEADHLVSAPCLGRSPWRSNRPKGLAAEAQPGEPGALRARAGGLTLPATQDGCGDERVHGPAPKSAVADTGCLCALSASLMKEESLSWADLGRRSFSACWPQTAGMAAAKAVDRRGVGGWPARSSHDRPASPSPSGPAPARRLDAPGPVPPHKP